MKLGQGVAGDAQWAAFRRSTGPRWAEPEAAHSIALLAALSHLADFSVGCYCENEARCRRSLLRELLAGAGAKLA